MSYFDLPDTGPMVLILSFSFPSSELPEGQVFDLLQVVYELEEGLVADDVDTLRIAS